MVFILRSGIKIKRMKFKMDEFKKLIVTRTGDLILDEKGISIMLGDKLIECNWNTLYDLLIALS